MNGFNLSDWALRHKSIVVYLMLVAAFAGLWAWGKLGREEDPAFTIKTMVVKTTWPGATANEMLQQVTDRIEKKLEELPNLDFVRSYTKPGESVVFVNLKDTVSGEATKPLWYQVRKKIDDIRHTLPSGEAIAIVLAVSFLALGWRPGIVGLIVATLLTLVFLPALYVAWFRIKPEAPQSDAVTKADAANVSLAAA